MCLQLKEQMPTKNLAKKTEPKSEKASHSAANRQEIHRGQRSAIDAQSLSKSDGRNSTSYIDLDKG
jgi:hypothetical protein